MKIHILSDLHNELLYDRDLLQIEQTDADLILLTGDIHSGAAGVEWACKESDRLGKPVVYIAGNHEYYGFEMLETMDAMRQMAEGHDVHMLENDELIIDDVRILGSTLWTDYKASGNQEQAMLICQHSINDHRWIRYGDDRFTTDHALALHQKAVELLTEKLNKPFPGKTVVATHHGPAAACQNRQYPVGPISAGFWSNLNHLVAQADLWVYGHTHDCLDQLINGTRFVSNQCGYRYSMNDAAECKEYDPKFVIDLETLEGKERGKQ